jgi:hypothetical protein
MPVGQRKEGEKCLGLNAQDFLVWYDMMLVGTKNRSTVGSFPSVSGFCPRFFLKFFVECNLEIVPADGIRRQRRQTILKLDTISRRIRLKRYGKKMV